MEDYSGPLARAKIYLRQAEEAFGDKKYENALLLLKRCDDEVRKAIAWVDNEMHPEPIAHHPV